MKYGIHLSTYTKTWNEDYFKYIKTSKELGYDGVELPLMDPDSFELEKAKSYLREYALLATCGTGLNPSKDISATDPIIRGKGISHLKKCIDICHELETDCLGGVLYSPWGQCFSREKAKNQINQSLNVLSEIGEYGKDKGVTLALEIINRYETYFINTVDDGLYYLKQINHPNIKLHFDTYHANIEEKNMKKALINGGKNIYHVHFSESDRGIPGTGQIEWQEVKEGLLAIQYNRWIIVENFVMPNCEVGNDTFTWRSIEKNGMTVAKESIKFIKHLMEE